MSENKKSSSANLTRTALYIRVSSEEQVQHGLSLEAQEAALTKWAKENNCEITDKYIDGGKTARKAISRRTELQRLLNDVASDKIDLIVFTKFDRWTRSVKDYYKIQETLDAHHTNWKAIFENYDTSTANGRLHINIMLSIAQDEADRTSERIKTVFARKIELGEATCPNLPVGYKLVNSRIVIDEDKKQIAQDLFAAYLRRQSLRKTADEISARYGIYMYNETIKHTLRNPLYIGTYRDRPNFAPALISPADFAAVQEILKNKNVKQTPNGYEYIFTSLLYCGECGHKLSGNAQKRTYSGGVEGFYTSYRCNSAHGNGKCAHKHVIGEKRIEEYLLNNVLFQLDAYVAECEVQPEAPPKPKINKSDIQKKLDKLKTLYIEDLIDLETYRRDYTSLKSQLDAITETPPPKPKNLAPLRQFLNETPSKPTPP